MDRKKPLIRTVPTDTASRMWRCCLYRTGRCSVTCKRGAYRPPSPLRTARRCATPRTAKRYFAVAFGNESGGYEIRNPFFKGCVPPKDVTLLPVGSATCNVYEGFMDYLSARALGIGGKEDHLVLNSVSNVARAYRHLDGYGRIKCYLDNDEAGRRTLGALLARYGGRVSNCSGIYDGCKDLNEHLQRVLAERQAQSENEKKNKSIRL